MSGADDPRVPGIRAAIEFVHGFCESYSRGYNPAADLGREFFNLHREMDYWLEQILEGEDGA